MTPPRRLWLDGLIVLGLMGLALWLRWPALFTEGFHNEDAAGIAFNADLLRRGGLPYVDALELKAPGSYWLSHWTWAAFGRSLVNLNRVACALALLALAGIYLTARLLHPGRAPAALAALLYTLASPVSDSIDINYGAWMITPYIWATAAFVWAWRRQRLWGFLLSGICLALAGLMKRQGGLLFPLFAGLLILDWARAWRAGDRFWARGQRTALLTFGVGLALGFAPITLRYALAGELEPFIRHYAFSEGGWRYVQGELSWAERLPRLWDGVLGFWEYLALPSLLAGATLLGGLGRRPGPVALLLAGHFAFSFLGAALGFRFFKSYYLQVLPAVAWIAAHPAGLLSLLRRPAWAGPRRILSGLALVAVTAATLPALRQDTRQIRQIRAMRQHPRDHDAQRAARVIRANSQPSDFIWVWGRWAWPVYYHADRLPPTRMYKVLGILTTNLTNTWRRPTRPTTFAADGPAAARLMADLEARPPAFIVVSRNEDYQRFTAFRTLLKDRYRPVPHLHLRQFVVYHRADHPLPEPPRPHPARRPAKRPDLKGERHAPPL